MKPQKEKCFQHILKKKWMPLCLLVIPFFLYGNSVLKPNWTIIYEFKNQENLKGWKVVSNQMENGNQMGMLKFDPQGAAIFSGELIEKINGGHWLMISPPTTLQLRSFAGLMLRLRGDGKHYMVCIYTQSKIEGVAYQAGFNTRKDRLSIIFLPFSSFVPYYQNRFVREWPVLDQSNINRFGIMIDDQQPGQFHLAVHWIKAVSY